MTRWWRRRSLRFRLTLIATVALAVGLGVGSLLLVRAFANSRLHAIDRSSVTVADNITRLTIAGALPVVLPVQAGQLGQVVDAEGAVVAASAGTLRTLPLLGLDRIRSMSGGAADDAVVDAIDGQGLSRVVVKPAGSGFVVIAVSLRDERDTLRGIARGAAVIVPVLLFLIATILWLLLGRALGAVGDLRRAALAIVDPGAGRRLPLPGSQDEIHALTGTLNEMLDRLAAAHDRERDFLADAAHELRSPIASMRAQLEVAQAHPGTTTVREVAAGSLTDVDRLALLVEALLALARLDAGMTLAPVDLAALVDQPGPLMVQGDELALRRAIDNLIANAQGHARAVVVTARAVDGWAEVRVEDDGPGIPADQRERVFERFVRLDDARSRDAGGSGLGLAIVRTTARAHHGDVTVQESSLGGACFVLRLPLGRQADVDSRP
jgi:signal transduction histidine kinase